jgi:hypothetical protein
MGLRGWMSGCRRRRLLGRTDGFLDKNALEPRSRLLLSNFRETLLLTCFELQVYIPLRLHRGRGVEKKCVYRVHTDM